MASLQRPARTRTYDTPLFDSRRWDRFTPRDGDVVVCTPMKCGTTWTQLLCAFLLHGSTQLPAPLSRLSPWLERHTEPLDEALAALERQPHRRVLKTHTPLDGLPYYDNVQYVFCGRDPRDAFLSMIDHVDNGNPAVAADARRRAGVGDDFVFPGPNALFPVWLTRGMVPWMDDGFPVGSVLGLTRTYWAFRRLPNLHFVHYADLTRDLDAELRRLAGALGVPVDEARWPEYLAAARFDAMRARADELAPGAHTGEWRRNEDFFRRARTGQWRDALTWWNRALYQAISRWRLEPALKAWLEGGRAAAGDPRAA